MNYWNFTSPNNWYSLQVPKNWAEFEDEDDVCAFFNSEEWTGNLRITAFRWPTETKIDKAFEYIESELADNIGAVSSKLGAWDATFYSKESQNDCITYYWVTGLRNNLFLCSFTINKAFFNTDRNSKELAIVEDILSSLKVLD